MDPQEPADTPAERAARRPSTADPREGRASAEPADPARWDGRTGPRRMLAP